MRRLPLSMIIALPIRSTRSSIRILCEPLGARCKLSIRVEIRRCYLTHELLSLKRPPAVAEGRVGISSSQLNFFSVSGPHVAL